MSKEFYGIIEKTEVHEETYTVTNKRGKSIQKKRVIRTPRSYIYKTGESTRLLGMQILNTEAKRVNGTVGATGTF